MIDYADYWSKVRRAHNSKHERNREIWEAAQKESKASVGRRYGISRGRVRAIVWEQEREKNTGRP